MMQTVDLEQTQLFPQQQKLDRIAEQNEIYRKGLEASIADADHNTQVFQQSVTNESNAINTLNDKISSTQTSKVVSDVFVRRNLLQTLCNEADTTLVQYIYFGNWQCHQSWPSGSFQSPRSIERCNQAA